MEKPRLSDSQCKPNANSGQTSINFGDLDCDAEPPMFKNCKDLIM